ncbi:BA14K family protein [Phyllobacterium sp. 628]|uniref:BA14K family protein n=1 Tax=Phyllobacterium sp. 628 TaxID=2718938 RepID=UPI0016624394|nr:BA14K family protein [Phyllobacterium sp. 628]QND53590.1 BA14K family protein [Phyllobacterium sp. 628]
MSEQNEVDMIMTKNLITILAALGLLLTANAGIAVAQVQPYRPAPRGNDPVPRAPIILGLDSSPNIASPNCTGSTRCNDFRGRKPIINSPGKTSTQRCQDRYQSYRSFDNTYQPRSGPRRACDL